MSAPTHCPHCGGQLEPVARIKEIQQAVADEWRISMTDLLSNRQDRRIVRPRHVAIYLCLQLTQHRRTTIGRMFAGRGHDNVWYAEKAARNFIYWDEKNAARVERVRQRLDTITKRVRVRNRRTA